ncbi:hypothetical protein AX14_003884 [Amanita brunnescens Koide BX004]|nr:hypothetical protein AX14_003884 [Amanita brunnescens Koide BX004]
MYYALNIINPHITARGAPLLESLTLMRCNDFVSFSPEFRPRHLVKPAFLQRKKNPNSNPNVNANVLPRLKHLTLKGVHVDWTALADAVEASQVGGLKSLSLGSHSAQVRPSHRAFRRLLRASAAALEVLSVCGSGPVSSPSSPSTTTATTTGTESSEKVRLGNLQKLVVGYRSAREARKVFDSISGAVREVVLEDVAHPGDVIDVDGNSVLACLLSSAAHDRGEEAPLLSQIEELSLRNVKLGKRAADRETLRTLLDGATRLRKLKVEDGSVENALMALVPDPASGCPCPNMESIAVKAGLTVSDPELLGVGVWFEMTKRMVEERSKAASLRQVKISMELPHGSCAVSERVEAVVAGTFVAIEVREKARMHDADVDEEAEDEAEAYLPGGTFNDPIFDARWARGAGEEQLPVKLGVVV